MRGGNWRFFFFFFFFEKRMSLRARRDTVPAKPWQRCPQGRQHTEMQLWDLFFCTVSAIPFWGKSCRIYMSSSHLETQLPSRNTDPVRLHFHDQSPHSWKANMSFFNVRFTRKHDETAKRNQMPLFAFQDIAYLETYDLRTCGVASAEIMLKNRII